MKRKFLLLTISIMIVSFSSISQNPDSTFIDSRDHTVYKTVKIGTQTWMAENLKFKTDSNSYCYKDSNIYCAKYGRLYTWRAAKTACPSGWHLPTDSDWNTLTTYLGGREVAGGKLKSTSSWSSPNSGATDSCGFTALPGGSRTEAAVFMNIGKNGNWWSSTEANVVGAYIRSLYAGTGIFGRGGCNKSIGCSVRCIKN